MSFFLWIVWTIVDKPRAEFAPVWTRAEFAQGYLVGAESVPLYVVGAKFTQGK